MSVFFNGRRIVTPASASMVDTSAMYNKSSTSGNIVALIGRANGGKPLTSLRFGSAAEARAVLQGDDIALKAVEKAFDPSADTGGASTLVFVRVNPATQSALTLSDASSAPAITLVSTDYGLSNNQIKVKVETASVTGKKVTTQLGTSFAVGDNLYRNALSLSYAGAAVSATTTINGTQLILKTAGTIIDTIDLSVFPTIQQLVDRINTVAGFSAAVLDGNGEAPALLGLDFVTDADVKTAALTVTGNLQAIIDWLNSNVEGYVTASRASGAGKVPNNIAFTYMSGASDGVVTNAQFQAAYDLLQQEDVQWITPLSSAAAIHAMNDAHCTYMSLVGGMERRGICGGGTGVTDTDALAAAKALNSERTSYTHLGIYDYNSAGTLTLYPAYVVAAMVSGMFSAVTPGTALTNKSVKARGLERKLRIPTDTDVLLEGGVLCLTETKKGFKIAKSISTWLVNDNHVQVEQSVGAAADMTVRTVRESLDDLRGKGGSPLILAEAVSRAQTALKMLSDAPPLGLGILVGDDKSPPFRKLQASLIGDSVRVSYEASPVIPVNYVLQTAALVPYSGSASA